MWSILMVILFRTFALKEADAEMITVEEEVPDVPEMLEGSPQVEEEKVGKSNPLSASQLSIGIEASVRTIKRQKSVRSQKSTVWNMEPIRDIAMVPQELTDSQR